MKHLPKPTEFILTTALFLYGAALACVHTQELPHAHFQVFARAVNASDDLQGNTVPSLQNASECSFVSRPETLRTGCFSWDLTGVSHNQVAYF